VLVLSATPIPRTLVLTYFGDMDVSELREKPAGRQPIEPARCRSAASTK
jgi:ATP-dependent DNA helicase RecG